MKGMCQVRCGRAGNKETWKQKGWTKETDTRKQEYKEHLKPNMKKIVLIPKKW
jgi:hypothetical protein